MTAPAKTSSRSRPSRNRLPRPAPRSERGEVSVSGVTVGDVLILKAGHDAVRLGVASKIESDYVRVQIDDAREWAAWLLTYLPSEILANLGPLETFL